MNPNNRKVIASIQEISEEEAIKILEASKQRRPYSEDEKADAYYREHA